MKVSYEKCPWKVRPHFGWGGNELCPFCWFATKILKDGRRVHFDWKSYATLDFFTDEEIAKMADEDSIVFWAEEITDVSQVAAEWELQQEQVEVVK